MKESFDVVKTSLEDYFVKKIIPESLKCELRDSKKTDVRLNHREHLGLVILSFFLRWLNRKEVYVPAINNLNYDDGVICNTNTREFLSVEQAYVFEETWDNKITQGIKDVLSRKREKGEEYASGSILLIFSNAEGDLILSSIKNELEKSFFKSVLIIGPSGKGKYDYNIILAKENNDILNSHLELSINQSNGKCRINFAKRKKE